MIINAIDFSQVFALGPLGSIFSALALAVSTITIVITATGLKLKKQNFIEVGVRLFHVHGLLLYFCIFVLICALVFPDFSLVYAVKNSSLSLPRFYKITALWAGQAGSLLWWNFLVVIFSLLAIRSIRKKMPVLIPYMVIILMTISFLFCVLANFSADCDPFLVYGVAKANGAGLNPLLQHWAMIIHPPILYLGYVSFCIPYAIVMAALWSRRVNINWPLLVRRCTVFSWFFLTMGILLGGKWAYEILDWNGYWGWDPVENSSLMPWLTGTAFLHSIIVQEKRGMLKVWNMVLVSLSLAMSILGTFLTRTGLVNSVHAFARSQDASFITTIFVLFLVLILGLTAYLIATRYQLLRSDHPFNSFLSREAGFLFNNVMLLIALFAILWGSLYPVLTDFLGDRQAVSEAWYTRVMTPIGLIILFLTGSGPLLAWRKTSAKTLLKNFRTPVIVFSICMGILYFVIDIQGMTSPHLAILSFSLSAFVVAGVAEELIKAGLNRKRYTKESFFVALLMMLFQNKRRFIGYMVHLGLAIMYIGFTGKAFNQEARISLRDGGAETFQNYTIVLDKAETVRVAPKGRGLHYRGLKLNMQVYKDNELVGERVTEKRIYTSFDLQENRTIRDGQDTKTPAIINDGFTDVYVQFSGFSQEEQRYVFSIGINPLIRFVWVGFFFMVFWGLLLLLPIGEGKTIKVFNAEFNVNPKPAKSSNLL